MACGVGNPLCRVVAYEIIVENLDEAIKHYTEDYGIGPWKLGGIDNKQLPEIMVNGQKGVEICTKNAFIDIYGFEIELIEPISASPYKTWLEEHGPGIHHIAAITRDPFNKVIEEHKALTGKDPWLWCKEENIGMEFAYLDLTKELGLFVEVYNEDKTGGLEA